MKRLFILTIIVGCVSVGTISAQPELDTTFSNDGKMILGSGLGAANDVVVQPDNKVVMVGTCATSNGVHGFCLVRLNENGTGDNTFGTSGVGLVWTSFGRSSSGLALQSDGKIVSVGGAGPLSDETTGLVRYNADGSLDTSFGSGGMVSINIVRGVDERAEKVAIQPDGKILVTGYSGDLSDSSTFYKGYVARFLPNGTLDPSFAVGGIFEISITGNYTYGHAIVLQPDGKIIVGGMNETVPGFPGPAAAAHLIIRLNSDGSPDNTWDNDGFRTIVFGTGQFPDGGIVALALQPDGRLLALARENILYRFHSDGSLDSSFDGDGSRQALSQFSTDPYDLVVTAGGKITVVGERRYWEFISVTLVYFTARYRADGSLDPSYSDDGLLDISNGTHAGSRAIAADSLGRVVIAGRSAGGTTANPFENSQFSAARLVAPVVAVGISGRVTRPDGRPVMNVVLSTQDSMGATRIARTNPFGYYRFVNLSIGQSYTIAARYKGVTFTDRTVLVSDDVVNFDFVAQAP